MPHTPGNRPDSFDAGRRQQKKKPSKRMAAILSRQTQGDAEGSDLPVVSFPDGGVDSDQPAASAIMPSVQREAEPEVEQGSP